MDLETEKDMSRAKKLAFTRLRAALGEGIAMHVCEDLITTEWNRYERRSEAVCKKMKMGSDASFATSASARHAKTEAVIRKIGT